MKIFLQAIEKIRNSDSRVEEEETLSSQISHRGKIYWNYFYFFPTWRLVWRIKKQRSQCDLCIFTRILQEYFYFGG